MKGGQRRVGGCPRFVACVARARSVGLVVVAAVSFVVAPSLVPFASVASCVSAQSAPDVTGEWEASYVSPLGPQELKIYLQQEGPRISGHTTSEFGEFQVRGSINGSDVKFSWSEVDGGKTITVNVSGKIEGDTITGTATIGDRGAGAFKAERTGS